MTTTAQEIFNLAMDLIDERTNTGAISKADTVSYEVKTPGLLTLLQAELIKQGEIFASYEISNTPIPNLLGESSNYDIREFVGTEFTIECLGSAKAYYFEVDRVGTVYVEDYNGAWNTIATVTTINTPDGFTSYKGIVTPSNGATKSRLRFTGVYYYRTVNRALFSVPFALDVDVPDYRPWIKKQMPADFKTVNEIIIESPVISYAKDSVYKWEGRRDLYISYYYKGNVRIIYHPVPSVIVLMSDEVQVDDVTARTILPYGLSAHLMLEENSATASFFNDRYEELKSVASVPPPASFESVENLYGGFG